MIDSVITRRGVIGLLAGCIMAGFARDGVAADAQAGQLENILLRMARQLYPHVALADTIYIDVLAPLESALAGDSSLAASLSAGHASLDAAAGGDWLNADTELQIAVLQSIENTEFFQTVLEAVRTELYYHPAVWELIGFEGSSVEYGGYIDRGFDDIDWLPED